MRPLDLTIAIINYNTKDWLDACLNSIIKIHPLVSYEIMVVDNGSTDGSLSHIHRNFPELAVIENAGNLGYAAAANQALRTSHARYVLILNTDVEVDSEAVDILVEFADGHADVGAVGPLLLNTDGTIQFSGRRFPSFTDAAMHAFLGIVWPENPFSVRYRMLDWDRQTSRTVDWVSGAAMLIRREAAERINYFDDRFFMYVEDVDFCYRLWQRGWKVYFHPEAKIVHHIAKTSGQSSARMIIEHQRSIYRFYGKLYSNGYKRWLRPVVAVGLVLRAGVLLAWDWIKRWRSGSSRVDRAIIRGKENQDTGLSGGEE